MYGILMNQSDKLYVYEFFTMANNIIFTFQDGPQFLIQMFNSMLVGQSWTWIQIGSALLSFKGLGYRFINRGHND